MSFSSRQTNNHKRKRPAPSVHRTTAGSTRPAAPVHTAAAAAAASNPNSAQQLTKFTSTLEHALDRNWTLQRHILEQLQLVANRMGDNRKRASQLSQALFASGETVEEEEDNSHDLDFCVNSVDAVLQQVLRDPQASADIKAKAQKQLQGDYRSNKKKKEVWQYNIYAKHWNRAFFQDPLGSTPPPNDEALQRHQLYSNHEMAFHHLHPPWNKAETRLLLDVIQQKQQQQQKQPKSKSKTSNSKIDFEQVATTLNEKPKPSANLPLQKPRTALECQLQYERCRAEKQKALSKTEQQKLAQLVQQQQQQKNDDNTDDQQQQQPTTSPIDWQAIAQQLGNDRTAWQCFQAYQSNSATNPALTQAVWTTTQDELLLKTLAALGPQFVVDNESCAQLSNQLFAGSKTVKQMGLRANSSLLNPNLYCQSWTLQEERKLVVAHKVYREPGQQQLVLNQFPHRSSRSIREKWSRHLNPQYHARHTPWSRQEDALLQKVVKNQLQQQSQALLKDDHDDDNDAENDDDDATTITNNNSKAILPWADLAREHFPGRRPEELRVRWTQELATDQDVLHKLKVDLVRQKGGGVSRGNEIASSAKKKKKSQEDGDESDSSGDGGTEQQQKGNSRRVLDGYALQLVKKRK